MDREGRDACFVYKRYTREEEEGLGATACYL